MENTHSKVQGLAYHRNQSDLRESSNGDVDALVHVECNRASGCSWIHSCKAGCYREKILIMSHGLDSLYNDYSAGQPSSSLQLEHPCTHA